jgi:hypothetical protein
MPKYMAPAKNPLMQKVGVQGLAMGHIQRYPRGCVCSQGGPSYTSEFSRRLLPNLHTKFRLNSLHRKSIILGKMKFTHAPRTCF